MSHATPPAGPTTATGRTTIAFFDVDETVVAAKTMLDFWEFWAGSGLWPLPARVSDLRARAAAGEDRTVLNRAFYRRFAGVPLALLRSAARAWYDAHRLGERAFVTAGVRAVERHRALGHDVVLVSGSLRPLLEAVAEDLGAVEVRCTEQAVTDDGVLTGEVDRPMIGPAKADAVTAVARARGARTADCYGYGDHESDLAMLRSVGHAAVVGGSPALAREAERAGWAVLDGHRGPRRAPAHAGHHPLPASGNR
ncbi:HAD-IB family hydrolase [Streptomyces lincolnensis]|uniref:HAD family hydrolase n=1 Tax=Streptomyces lincolnensis TaxID=1915 RepID=UPI001E5A19D5|nr:HAD-IB family hydrolase [Streptomyces lincolnensis]MCD7437279.1 HAD-IB family hydrolase [Streptomyces lincolnensis]